MVFGQFYMILQKVIFAETTAITPITLEKWGGNDRYNTNHYRIPWNNTIPLLEII